MSRRFLAALALAALACSSSDSADDAPASQSRSGSVDLTGAGATFPAPLYAKWTSDYANATGVRINYQSIGSGGGIRQISERTVDFGATDGPMTDAELSGAKGGRIMHFPTVLGAVVIAYNLPGFAGELRLSGPVIAEIFLDRIKKWNDPKIAALNPGASLPNTDILVVHRSDGSGTTYVFTDYLSAISPAWAAGPGRGKDIAWPTGLGGKGNEGVAGQIKQIPGALGYVELAYARQNNLPTASVQNAAGNFVKPSIEAITAAAEGVAERLPANTDYRISIVNSPGANSYPISSFTWLLVYEQQADSVKSRKLVDFIRWALTEGEKQAAALDYAPLPPAIADRLVQRLDSIRTAPSGG